MRIRTLFGSFLEVGGHLQFVLSLSGALGLTGVMALLLSLIAPSSWWGWCFVGFVALASVPFTFPLSAWGLNVGLAHVEATRRRNVFDEPNERARKKIDTLIESAHDFQAWLPSGTPTSDELRECAARLEHWLFSTDAQVSRVTNQYGSKLFLIDTDPEYWRDDAHPRDISTIKSLLEGAITSLTEVRESLPVSRKKWLRRTLGVDISAGRALASHIRSLDDASDEGHKEIDRWASSARRALRDDMPDQEHLFAAETYAHLRTRNERVEYVEARISDLIRLANEL